MAGVRRARHRLGREVTSAGENQLDTGGLTWILPFIGIVVVLAGITGFFAWYFTRFVIDDEELRIETGAIFEKSTKIPFERLQSVDIIQPLVARIFGLAELRLDAGNSSTKLRYLSRGKASRLRDYLLTRAHGEQAAFAILINKQRRASSPTWGRPISRWFRCRRGLIVSFLLSASG